MVIKLRKNNRNLEYESKQKVDQYDFKNSHCKYALHALKLDQILFYFKVFEFHQYRMILKTTIELQCGTKAAMNCSASFSYPRQFVI